jgi:hypothetical protein
MTLDKESNSSIIIQEPATIDTVADPFTSNISNPIAFILLLPFLPLYMLAKLFQQMNSTAATTATRRGIRVTRINRLPDGGYEIIEIER